MGKKDSKPPASHRQLMVLARKTSAWLSTPEGKAALRQAVDAPTPLADGLRQASKGPWRMVD